MSHQKYHDYVRRVVSVVAGELIESKVPFLDGVRRISELRLELPDVEREPLDLFMVVDSEADELPPAAIRHLCEPGWIARCDAEAEKLRDFYEANILHACNLLVQRYVSLAEDEMTVSVHKL